MAKRFNQKNGSLLYWSAETWAFLSLRLFLSFRFLTAGLEKFRDGHGNQSFENYYHSWIPAIQDKLEPTLLPSLIYSPFLYLIAYWNLLLGISLLLGLKTKYALALSALTLVSVSLGMMLIGDPALVNHLGIHLLMTTAGLYFVRHNKLELLR